MAKSSRFRQLESRLFFLENNILPESKITGNYTKKEQDLIRSFVVLCHAEIESYLEDKAKERAKKAVDAWNINRTKSNCLTAILAFVGNDLNYENDDNRNNLQYRINKSVAHYQSAIVDRNHGIKEKNILNLLLPIGIELGNLDQTWLNTMESFGSIRGTIAHSSIMVQNSIDRNTELNRIRSQILPELENIDDMIRRIR